MGVYFPYMVVDVNSHASYHGKGECETRRYVKGSGSDSKTYYDADLYEVARDFDLTINGLTVESSADKLDKKSSSKTNNVINAIMPFDIENSVKWNSNYLKGYTSERRDTNIDQLRPIVSQQSKDIARFSANDTLKQYNRGVKWESENLDVKGQQWKAAYLPVWLYSYRQVIDQNNSVLHYVAVNARTKETMGSVPIHMPMLLGISAAVELLGLLCTIITAFLDFDYSFIFLLAGFIFFFVMYIKYRNSNARHHYEMETKTKISNLQKVDNFIKKEKGLSNPKIEGANNTKVSGQTITEKAFDTISGALDFTNLNKK